MPEPKFTEKDWDEVRTAFASSSMVDTQISSLAQNLDGPTCPVKTKDETPAKYIDLSYGEAIWVQAAYLLAISVLLIPSGRLADDRGRWHRAHARRSRRNTRSERPPPAAANARRRDEAMLEGLAIISYSSR